jgi:hypothetical protein
MNDRVQETFDRLRNLALTATSDPRDAAGQIVRDFNVQASVADRKHLRRRLDDGLLVGRNTAVPYSQFEQHSVWLAVLEGAVSAFARQRSASSR